MRRLAALLLTLAIAASATGCGSAGPSGTAQCARFKAEAHAFARRFSAGIPNLSRSDIQRLAAAAYKATAAKHGISCR